MFELFLYSLYISTKHTLMIIEIYCMTSTLVMDNNVIKRLVVIGVLSTSRRKNLPSFLSLVGGMKNIRSCVFTHTHACTHARTHT